MGLLPKGEFRTHAAMGAGTICREKRAVRVTTVRALVDCRVCLHHLAVVGAFAALSRGFAPMFGSSVDDAGGDNL